MVKFDESASCTFIKDKIEVVTEQKEHDPKSKEHDEHKGEHSDFVANFSIDCKNEIQGTKVTFDFSQFKGLKDLDVTMLIGDLQKSVEIKRKPVTVELK